MILVISVMALITLTNLSKAKMIPGSFSCCIKIFPFGTVTNKHYLFSKLSVKLSQQFQRLRNFAFIKTSF